MNNFQQTCLYMALWNIFEGIYILNFSNESDLVYTKAFKIFYQSWHWGNVLISENKIKKRNSFSIKVVIYQCQGGLTLGDIWSQSYGLNAFNNA